MKNTMLATTVTIGLFAILLFIIAYSKGVHLSGLRDAYRIGTKVIPLIALALIIVGMVNNLISKDTIQTISGKNSGVKGIMLGTIAGIITPGGTFVAFPLAGTMLKQGVSIGVVVAYITAYSIFDITRLPVEVSFMGWKFVVAKWCCALLIPVASGLIARYLFSGIQF